jgi:hypothetical protein
MEDSPSTAAGKFWYEVSMREVSWATLLRHIPPEQQDGMMLITKAGTEITINNLLRIDREFVAFRGRLSGSQEGGRLFMVPYDNIDYLGTQKPIKDSDFQETFGNLVMPEPATIAVEDPIAPVAPSVPLAVGRTASAIKSAVLERFRSRSASSSQGVATRPPEG